MTQHINPSNKSAQIALNVPKNAPRKGTHEVSRNPDKMVIKKEHFGERLVKVDWRTSKYARPGETDQDVIDRHNKGLLK